MHLFIGIISMLPPPERCWLLPCIALGRLEEVVRTSGAGEADPMRAGMRGGHHCNGSNPGEGPGWFHLKDTPEMFAFMRLCCKEDCRVLRKSG
jgi:hypothetical protein